MCVRNGVVVCWEEKTFCLSLCDDPEIVVKRGRNEKIGIRLTLYFGSRQNQRDGFWLCRF